MVWSLGGRSPTQSFHHIFFPTEHKPSTLLSCTMKCKSMNLHNCISFFIHFVPGTFLVNWRCLSDSIPRVLSYLQFLQSPTLLNFYSTLIYYRSIHQFYLTSELDCSKKPVSLTRITSPVIFISYVILKYGECHNCVVITNAHATSILTCDRIASQNSQRFSRPYSKKMSWLHDQQQYCLRCIPLRSPLIQKDWNWLQHAIFYWNWMFKGVTHINFHILPRCERASNKSMFSFKVRVLHRQFRW